MQWRDWALYGITPGLTPYVELTTTPRLDSLSPACRGVESLDRCTRESNARQTGWNLLTLHDVVQCRTENLVPVEQTCTCLQGTTTRFGPG